MPNANRTRAILAAQKVRRVDDPKAIEQALKLTPEQRREMYAPKPATAAPQHLGPFESFKPLELQIMVDNGKYLLVTRPDVPLYHGYLVTRALMDSAASLKLTDPGTGRHGMAIHPGALAFYKGEKIDPPPPPPDK